MDSIDTFLNQKNYDIRQSRNARWIDQKCTYDVIQIIADAILEYTQDDCTLTFSVRDIWNSQYSQENVQTIFSKPKPDKPSSKREYDKFFGQPLKLLAYSGILLEQKSGRSYAYSIAQLEILQYIALRPLNALRFLTKYIRKVLSDSGLIATFNNFFNKQSKESYQKVRAVFFQFVYDNTPITGKDEPGRIFTKIINPLAFESQKKGTVKGGLSKDIITLQDLTYNRLNWRDERSGKAKSVSRNQHEIDRQPESTYSTYLIQKAKKDVRKFNQQFYNNKSEIYHIEEQVIASQIHHIFPQADYPSIADFLENLIAITPNQHFLMAHPDNNTQQIDRDFQYICLIAKCSHIMENLLCTTDQKPVYNFDNYKTVLNTGLRTEVFNEIAHLDFAAIIKKIDYFYSDFSDKYQSLKIDNYPKIPFQVA